MMKTATLTRTMPDLRKSVLAQMKRLDWSGYRLIQELKGKRKDGSDVRAVTVYEFLRGETAINSDDLGLIMAALKMDAGPITKPHRRPRK